MPNRKLGEKHSIEKSCSSFGEDLQQLALMAYELAHKHCDGCQDFHILWPYHRLAGNAGGVDSDRGELVPILSDIGMDKSNPHWLIAGAGDTGILATLATALGGQTEGSTNGFRVTVTDLCRTPLILCEEYGQRYGLKLKTHVGDLFDLPYENKFDGLLLHSLFSFIPNDAHECLMRTMRRSLKPGGKLIFCSRYGQGTWTPAEAEKHGDCFADKFGQAFRAGALVSPEDEEVFFQRTRRSASNYYTAMPGSFDSVQEMVDLLESAEFTVNSVVHSGSAVRPGTLAEVDRPKRVIITASRAAP